MSQFFTLLTKTGQGLLANAIAYGESLTIAEMAIGDGGGKLPTPDAAVTRLVNEVRRGPINQTSVDADNPNWTVVEQVLPAEVGGWTIREVGLYDTDGNLIAYGNYPETYKPQLSEGSSRTQTIRFVMEVTDTSAVTLRIDPSVVMASRKYVDDRDAEHAKSRNHPDADTKNKGFIRFATLAESRKGEESKAAQTPAGGKAQLDDHRDEARAHKAGQIALDQAVDLFGDADSVQKALSNIEALGLTRGRLLNVQVFRESGTYTPAAQCNSVIVEGCGGGGGGGGAARTGSNQVSGGGGGQGGACGKSRFTREEIGESVAITIGRGGSPGSGDSRAEAQAASGGTTSFGPLMSLPGGNGAVRQGPSSPPLVGGNSSMSTGAPVGCNIVKTFGEDGDDCFFFDANNGRSGWGGPSWYGQAVGNRVTNGDGNTAYDAGTGGSGAVNRQNQGTDRIGGAGADGLLIVWEFA